MMCEDGTVVLVKKEVDVQREQFSARRNDRDLRLSPVYGSRRRRKGIEPAFGVVGDGADLVGTPPVRDCHEGFPSAHEVIANVAHNLEDEDFRLRVPSIDGAQAVVKPEEPRLAFAIQGPSLVFEKLGESQNEGQYDGL